MSRSAPPLRVLPPELETRSPLDPEDWERFRAELHRAADRLVDHVRDARHWPVWQEMPAEVVNGLSAPISREGLGAGEAWDLLEMGADRPFTTSAGISCQTGQWRASRT